MALPRIGDCVEESQEAQDRKSTRLNSSHSQISYAVFCLKKKKKYISISRSCFSALVCGVGALDGTCMMTSRTEMRTVTTTDAERALVCPAMRRPPIPRN